MNIHLLSCSNLLQDSFITKQVFDISTHPMWIFFLSLKLFNYSICTFWLFMIYIYEKSQGAKKFKKHICYTNQSLTFNNQIFGSKIEAHYNDFLKCN
jgi:hypothetical protein